MDLTKNPPRSPKIPLGGIVALPRFIDKARAASVANSANTNSARVQPLISGSLVYTLPATIADIVNHTVSRVLDLFDIESELAPRWGRVLQPRAREERREAFLVNHSTTNHTI